MHLASHERQEGRTARTATSSLYLISAPQPRVHFTPMPCACEGVRPGDVGLKCRSGRRNVLGQSNTRGLLQASVGPQNAVEALLWPLLKRLAERLGITHIIHNCLARGAGGDTPDQGGLKL
eukprot:scaffold35022_cov33-Tisochrysis_lutea.AAC.3